MKSVWSRRGGLVATIFFLAGLLAGCAPQAAAQPVATNQVEMPPSYRFAPEVIRVPVDTTVTWHNSDNFTHSVHLLDGSNVDKVAHPGDSVTITFSKAGTYRYTCTFHSQQMKGEVDVVNQ